MPAIGYEPVILCLISPSSPILAELGQYMDCVHPWRYALSSELCCSTSEPPLRAEPDAYALSTRLRRLQNQSIYLIGNWHPITWFSTTFHVPLFLWEGFHNLVLPMQIRPFIQMAWPTQHRCWMLLSCSTSRLLISFDLATSRNLLLICYWCCNLSYLYW